MGTRTLTTPDLYDDRGRSPVGSRMRAYRCDTHVFVEEQNLDDNGQATFTSLPTGTDTVYHTVWGGKVGYGKYQWFPIRFMQITDGGTGGTTPEEARENLGIDGACMLWAIVL